MEKNKRAIPVYASYGGAAKAHEGGRVTGYLVRFTGPDAPDLVGEYFTSSTYYGKHEGDGVDGLFHHGFPVHPDLKGFANHIFTNPLKVTRDEIGLFAEVVLDLRNEYEKAIYETAKAGLLGWSSGAGSHMVRYAEGGEITRWPIIEGSLTPTPAEPKNTAFTKSLDISPAPALVDGLLAASVPKNESRITPSVAEIKANAAEIGNLEAGTGPATEPDAAKAALDIEANPTQQLKKMEPNTQPTATQALEPGIELVAQVGGIKTYSQADLDAYVNAAIDRTLHATRSTPGVGVAAPALNLKTKPGHTKEQALAYWYKTGDIGAVQEFVSGKADGTITGDARLHGQPLISIKASNDTDMNIGTAADGGNAVPTGHFNQIIARMDESRLQVGVREIPGRGTTVNVPIDNEDDGEFVSTAEAVAYDRDAPAIGQKALTLVKYTKNIEMSVELLDDEDSAILAFVENFVGRGMAKTHNNLLVTEVTTNGTLYKTTASATVLAAGELEDVVYNDDLGDYLDDSASNAWIARRSTFGAIQKITGSDRLYGENPGGTRSGRTILGYPMQFSQKVAAYGTTTNKFALFGNFFYVGMRNGNTIEFLRNPYLLASSAQVVFHYHFRTVYGVLQAEAVGWIAHA